MVKRNRKQETHEKAMACVGELRHNNQYRQADEMMKLASCAHLKLINQGRVKEQGIDDYYDVGDVLLSSAEDFGNRKDKEESFEAWDERTKNRLQDCYMCEATGEHCISRTINFHYSDIREGHCNEVYTKIDVQIRCPSFEHREGLVEKLNKEKRK